MEELWSNYCLGYFRCQTMADYLDALGGLSTFEELMVDQREELGILWKQFLTLKGDSEKLYPRTTYQYMFAMPDCIGVVGRKGVVDAKGPTKAVLLGAFFDFFNHSSTYEDIFQTREDGNLQHLKSLRCISTKQRDKAGENIMRPRVYGILFEEVSKMGEALRTGFSCPVTSLKNAEELSHVSLKRIQTQAKRNNSEQLQFIFGATDHFMHAIEHMICGERSRLTQFVMDSKYFSFDQITVGGLPEWNKKRLL